MKKNGAFKDHFGVQICINLHPYDVVQTPVAAAKPLPDTPVDATTRLDYDDAEEQEQEEQVDTTMEDVPSHDGAAQEEDDDADEEEEEAGEQRTPVWRRCRLNTSVSFDCVCVVYI